MAKRSSPYIRRQAISYRRHIVPQRDALSRLSLTPPALLSSRDQAELRVAMEQSARVADALEELRDRAAVTQEEMRARHEARISRTVYLLTIVATIALPLGIFTGLLGITHYAMEPTIYRRSGRASLLRYALKACTSHLSLNQKLSPS